MAGDHHADEEARLKVCLIVTRMVVGGAQETVLALARGLAAADVNVMVLAGASDDPGTLWSELDGHGVETRRLRYMRRAIRPVADLLCLIELVQFLHRAAPEVVHTHSSKAGVIGRLAARLAGVHMIVHTIHGWSFRDYQRGTAQRLYIGLERALARWCTDRLVVVTTTDREEGLRRGIGRPRQYATIRSGIDLTRFTRAAAVRARMRSELRIPPNEVVVGSVTRFDHPKDTRTLVRAVALLEMPDVRTLIVGDGSERSSLEAMCERLGVSDRVVFLGERRDVHVVMQTFDVFVLASLSEGLPRVVVEAAALGLPIVASNVGGVAEVVAPARGWLVPPGEPLALAEALASAIEYDRGAAGAADGRELLIRSFSTEAMVDATLGLYRSDLRQ